LHQVSSWHKIPNILNPSWSIQRKKNHSLYLFDSKICATCTIRRLEITTNMFQIFLGSHSLFKSAWWICSFINHCTLQLGGFILEMEQN
jgi:hypothetical protein